MAANENRAVPLNGTDSTSDADTSSVSSSESTCVACGDPTLPPEKTRWTGERHCVVCQKTYCADCLCPCDFREVAHAKALTLTDPTVAEPRLYASLSPDEKKLLGLYFCLVALRVDSPDVAGEPETQRMDSPAALERFLREPAATLATGGYDVVLLNPQHTLGRDLRNVLRDGLTYRLLPTREAFEQARNLSVATGLHHLLLFHAFAAREGRPVQHILERWGDKYHARWANGAAADLRANTTLLHMDATADGLFRSSHTTTSDSERHKGAVCLDPLFALAQDQHNQRDRVCVLFQKARSLS